MFLSKTPQIRILLCQTCTLSYCDPNLIPGEIAHAQLDQYQSHLEHPPLCLG